MKRHMLRLGLSLMLAAGWWVQRLPAQTPQPSCSCAAASQAPASQGAGADVPYRSWLRRVGNHFGLCCWTTHNQPGCGSLRAETVFFFGSCHAYFGEPCLVPPPDQQHVAPAMYSTWGHGGGFLPP
jgi:hypothetical protein